MLSFLRPSSTLSSRDVRSSLRLMTAEGVATEGFFSLTSGGFMASYALALGANNLQVGILAALPFAAQIVCSFPPSWLWSASGSGRPLACRLGS